MIIYERELDRMKHPEEFKYKVYRVNSGYVYGGHALVGAKSLDDARSIKREFADADTDNVKDSWGWEGIVETSKVSDERGILDNGIYYVG